MRPAATAAAEPPLDPPGLKPCFHGFCVAPNASPSVNGKIASSGRCVRPTITAPAARRRFTTSASWAAGWSKAREPCIDTSPAMSTLSLIATGTPSSGRLSPAVRRAAAWSASARARSW